MGIDEIALLKGHRDFVAVISAQTEAGHVQVLAVLPDRRKATVVAWIKTIPVHIRARITTICTDMWAGYITAVQGGTPDGDPRERPLSRGPALSRRRG